MTTETAFHNEYGTTRSSNDELVKSVDLTDDSIAFFKKKGFLKIKKVLTSTAISALREAAETEVIGASDIGATYGDTFNKLSYGLAKSDIFKAVYTSHAFKKLIGELIDTRIIATEANGFQLTPGKTGFPWHYGSLSFRYIRPEDMAWSIWFPLDPINPKEQNGGMAYVPEDFASCAFNYQMSSIIAELKRGDENTDEITESLNRIFGFSGKLTTEVFERNKEELSFDVGDAFIFNKNIWHRSSALLPGPLSSRLAVNMRFIDWRSRLDMLRYQGEAETGGGLGLGVDFGHQRQTTFGSHFTDISNGERIRDSIHCGEII